MSEREDIAKSIDLEWEEWFNKWAVKTQVDHRYDNTYTVEYTISDEAWENRPK